MKKRILLSAFLIGFVFVGKAQVGIGNAVPNTGSILDLTNTNDKSLILPTSTIIPTSVGTFTVQGMLFYYQDKLFLKTSTGVNVLSPWLFDGVTTNGIYSASGTPIGIGIAPLASSTAILTVADAAGDVTAAGSNASIVVGDNDFSASHLMIDEDEIMAKTNATTAGLLKFQEEGGTTQIRSATADAGVTTVLTAYGSVDAKGKVRENANDLLPVGSIIMFAGAAAPAGWALCDGGSHPLQDGSGNVTVPDLRNRFIVGAGSTYSYTNTGGTATNTLTTTELPAHTHTASTSSDGAHTHSYTSPGGNNNCWCACACTGSSLADPGVGSTTGSSGAHTHTVTVNSAGSGSAFTNLPPYYALSFIYKL